MTTNDNRSRAVLARDAALARVRRTRRWVIAGAAALTAGFAALVSAVAPGRSLASKSSVRTEASTGSSPARPASTAIPKLPPAANPGSLGLGGSSQQPQTPPSQPQTAPSQPQNSQPAQPTPPASPPQASPPPQSSGGGGVVSGGS